MRNILQYPITYKEKEKFLTELREKILEEYKENAVCGDMKAAIISDILEDIWRLRDLCD